MSAKSGPSPRADTANSYESEILGSLRQISRALDISSRQLKAGYQITTPQLVCLLALVEPGLHTATSLAAGIHLSPSTIVGIVDRLEQRGLAMRERDTADRRVVYISATTKGRRLVTTVPGPLQRNFAKGLKRLSHQQRASISAALKMVVDLMEASDFSA